MLARPKNNLKFFVAIIALAILLTLLFSTQTKIASVHNTQQFPPSAVILQYHHIDDNTPNATSTSVALFKQQMELLKTLNFKVLPLTTIIQSLKSGKLLPPRTVGLTFDDAYSNFLTNAWPILKNYGYPSTLFVATTHISEQPSEFLSWAQLRRLVKQGVEIGAHSHSHNYLARELYTNPLALNKVKNDIELSLKFIKQNLSLEANFFAYPYGEYTLSFSQLIAQMGLIGFGQHSGPINGKSNFTALPRFPASNDYGQIETLTEKLFTRPFENFSNEPKEPFTQESRPTLKMTFSDSSLKVSCYASSQGIIPVSVKIKDSQLVITTRSRTPIGEGRSRYNCTAPANEHYFFWFSQPWVSVR